ncbi:MAG: MFS transporter [archaeon]|nr:MFS transporter [archaeon]
MSLNSDSTDFNERNQIQSKKSFWDNPKLQVGLFLPIILLMSGDLGVLIANEIMICVDLGIGESQIGIIIGVHYLTNGIFTFIFGYLADKLPRKRLLIGGSVFWVIGTILTSYATSFEQMILFRIISAIGLGSQSSVVFSLLSDIFSSEKRSNSFAWWGVVNLIGNLFVGGLAMSASEIDWDVINTACENYACKIAMVASNYAEECSKWREPYLQIAVIGIVFFILLLVIKEPKRAATEKVLRDVLSDENVDYSTQYIIKKEDLKIIYKRRTNIWLALNWFDVVTSGVLTAYLLTFLTTDLGFNINFSNPTADIIVLLIGIVLVMGINLVGQFYFAKMGDKNVDRGDIRGRIKIMVYAAVVSLPILTFTILLVPNYYQKTIFMGAMTVSDPILIAAFMLFFALLGLGMAINSGGTSNWYACMLDVNLPEHRGTMISVASFADTVGRAIGAIAGGFFIEMFGGMGVVAPIALMLLVVNLIFGTLAALFGLPAIKSSEKDLNEVNLILEQRAKELEIQRKNN